jgi:hypothetical protein
VTICLFNFRATGFEGSILCEHGLLNAFCRHDFSERDFAASRRDSPELCQNFSPSSMRGRRECRALDAPAGRVCVCEYWNSHALDRSHRNHQAFPAQCFTAYGVLSSAVAFFAVAGFRATPLFDWDGMVVDIALICISVNQNIPRNRIFVRLGVNALMSQTRYSVTSAAFGRAKTKISKTTPCKVRISPGSRRSCCALSGGRGITGPGSHPSPG